VIRVCIVEDQTLVREGLKSLLALADGIEVVAEATDGEDALEVVPACAPDVVLLDMRMPKKNGLEVLEALAARDALPPTLILTTFDDDEIVLKGVRAGARGFLLKDVSLDRLTEAIETIAAGGTLVRPAVTERVLRGVEAVGADFDALEPMEPMTKRETEILRLIAGGYANKEIAEALAVSEGTVKNHVSNILSKMGVRDRTRAVLKALELGVV
jgi:DNA-binding NarL/FixJ family response regulator